MAIFLHDALEKDANKLLLDLLDDPETVGKELFSYPIRIGWKMGDVLEITLQFDENSPISVTRNFEIVRFDEFNAYFTLHR